MYYYGTNGYYTLCNARAIYLFYELLFFPVHKIKQNKQVLQLPNFMKKAV